jgi:type II secretory pathway component PulF
VTGVQTCALPISPLYFVFSLLEFLTKSGIDVFHAMDSVITASMKNDKLCGALTRVKESMRAGSAMSDSFAREKIFENYLFYLETASANGTSGTFFLVAQQIEKKREIREIVFFKIVEPSMLIAAGIYMLLILRCTVIPLMMNYGGIL